GVLAADRVVADTRPLTELCAGRDADVGTEDQLVVRSGRLDGDLRLHAGHGPELALVALLAGISFPRDAAHYLPLLVVVAIHPGEVGGGSAEVLAVGLELLQQLEVVAGR